MKAFKVIIKICVAVAAIAGIVYLAATYGDRIVAWAKKLLNSCNCCNCGCDCDCECDCDDCDCECECNCACECTEEAPAEEAVVADQADFEG